MSAIYARLVEASRSGRLNVAFEEMITAFEDALRSGKNYLHPVASDAEGLDLLSRLHSEGVKACLDKVDGTTFIEVDLSAIVNDSKVDGTSTVVLAPTASAEKDMTTRIRLVFYASANHIAAKTFDFLKKQGVTPTFVGLDIIEFVLPKLNDGITYTFKFVTSFSLPDAPTMYAFSRKRGWHNPCLLGELRQIMTACENDDRLTMWFSS